MRRSPSTAFSVTELTLKSGSGVGADVRDALGLTVGEDVDAHVGAQSTTTSGNLSAGPSVKLLKKAAGKAVVKAVGTPFG